MPTIRKPVRIAVLVYLSDGTAEVYEVDRFDFSPKERGKTQLIRCFGLPSIAVAFCDGLSENGTVVRSAYCPRTDRISNGRWFQPLEGMMELHYHPLPNSEDTQEI